MAVYDSFRATAQRLIDKYGRVVTIVAVPDNIPADADEPWEHVEPVDPPEYDVRGCVVPAFNYNRSDDIEVKATDKECLVAASVLEAAGLTREPSTKDTLIDGDKVYRIMACDTVNPGEQNVLFTLLLRK